jgi:hypothetical protein
MPSREVGVNVQRQVDAGRLSIFGLYAFFGLSGVLQVIAPNNAIVLYLNTIAIAFSATMWAVVDARRAQRPLLHIVQVLMFFSWPAAVPIYLIWSRRWRGFGLALLHAVALIFTASLFYYATMLLRYGPHAFSS